MHSYVFAYQKNDKLTYPSNNVKILQQDRFRLKKYTILNFGAIQLRLEIEELKLEN